MRRLLTIAIVLLSITAVFATRYRSQLEATDRPEVTTEAPATSTVEARIETLQVSVDLAGTVGFGTELGIYSTSEGVVTWASAESSVLMPGAMLAKVDERPLFWAMGAVPMYRELSKGKKGADVQQLQQLLANEGFLDDDAVDGDFGSSTRNALKQWQDQHGLTKSGRINATTLVFLDASSIRLAQTPTPGTLMSSQTFTYTTPQAEISVPVSAQEKGQLISATAVTLELASEPSIEVALIEIEADEAGDGFIATLSAANTPLTEGTVKIRVTETLADQAVTIPVAALLALADGGYAVEIPNSDGSTSLVGVELGVFAHGRVVVLAGVESGDTVVVP